MEIKYLKCTNFLITEDPTQWKWRFTIDFGEHCYNKKIALDIVERLLVRFSEAVPTKENAEKLGVLVNIIEGFSS